MFVGDPACRAGENGGAVEVEVQVQVQVEERQLDDVRLYAPEPIDVDDADGAVLRIDLGDTNARGEQASDAVIDACLSLLAHTDMAALDVGGRPAELHPRFRDLVILARALRRRVVCRASVAMMGMLRLWELPRLMAEHGVDLIAPLPGMPRDDGDETLMAVSVEALKRLNDAGYGSGDGTAPGRLDVVVEAPVDEEGLRESLGRRGVAVDRVLAVPIRRGGLRTPADLHGLVGAVSPERILRGPYGRVLRVSRDGALSSRPVGQEFERLLGVRIQELARPAPRRRPSPGACTLASLSK